MNHSWIDSLRWGVSVILICGAIVYATGEFFTIGYVTSLTAWSIGLLSIIVLCVAPKKAVRLGAVIGIFTAIVILWQRHTQDEIFSQETKEYGVIYNTMLVLYNKLSSYSQTDVARPATDLSYLLKSLALDEKETNFLNGITVTVYPLSVHREDRNDFIVFYRNGKYATVSQTGSVNLPFDFCRDAGQP